MAIFYCCACEASNDTDLGDNCFFCGHVKCGKCSSRPLRWVWISLTQIKRLLITSVIEAILSFTLKVILFMLTSKTNRTYLNPCQAVVWKIMQSQSTSNLCKTKGGVLIQTWADSLAIIGNRISSRIRGHDGANTRRRLSSLGGEVGNRSSGNTISGVGATFEKGWVELDIKRSGELLLIWTYPVASRDGHWWHPGLAFRESHFSFYSCWLRA